MFQFSWIVCFIPCLTNSSAFFEFSSKIPRPSHDIRSFSSKTACKTILYYGTKGVYPKNSALRHVFVTYSASLDLQEFFIPCLFQTSLRDVTSCLIWHNCYLVQLVLEEYSGPRKLASSGLVYFLVDCKLSNQASTNETWRDWFPIF